MLIITTSLVQSFSKECVISIYFNDEHIQFLWNRVRHKLTIRLHRKMRGATNIGIDSVIPYPLSFIRVYYLTFSLSSEELLFSYF